MNIRFATIIIACFASTNSLADADYQYSCSLDGAKQVIEVDYKTLSKKTPCSVNLVKEQSQRELWQAQKQSGYCETKASSYAKRLELTGWRCKRES